MPRTVFEPATITYSGTVSLNTLRNGVHVIYSEQIKH